MAIARKPASTVKAKGAATAKAKPAKGKGRPSRYHPAYAAQAETLLAENGATDAMLARMFGVSRETVTGWRRQHKDFRDACTRGREAFDVGAVEKALLRRATGYKVVEVTKEPGEPARLGEPGEPAPGEADALARAATPLRVVRTVTRHVPPDTGAARYFLNNRAPERWREKVQLDAGGTLRFDLPPSVEDMLHAIYRQVEGGAQQVEGGDRPVDGSDRPVDGSARPVDGSDRQVEGCARQVDGCVWPVDGSAAGDAASGIVAEVAS